MYFSKHLTNEDFDRIKNKIISFQNDKFTNLQNFIYISNARIGNGTKYNPRLYDINHKVFLIKLNLLLYHLKIQVFHY